MPSYVGTQRRTAKGMVLSIGDGASPEVFTKISELNSLELTGRQAQTDDATNFDSEEEEFIATIITPGEWSFSGSRISGDAGQQALSTAFAALASHNFTVVAPKTGTQTTGDTWAFKALVTDDGLSFAPTKGQAISGKLKISGPLAFTEGS